MQSTHAIPSRIAAGLMFAAVTLAAAPPVPTRHDPVAVNVRLSEWKVELSQRPIAAGSVTFAVTNTGSIPHAFEVEGQGIEKATDVIMPGSSATLKLTLKPGNYDLYCPVGGDSHKHLGMEAHLRVGNASSAGGSNQAARTSSESHEHEMEKPDPKAKMIRVTGGGPVIQILPGPFPFPDSAAPILKQFGDEREGLESQVKDGPYSNNVSPIAGTFSFAQSGASIVSQWRNAFRRHSSIHSGSPFFAEMKRTVSSFSPLGASSCSMSEEKPHS